MLKGLAWNEEDEALEAEATLVEEVLEQVEANYPINRTEDR